MGGVRVPDTFFPQSQPHRQARRAGQIRKVRPRPHGHRRLGGRSSGSLPPTARTPSIISAAARGTSGRDAGEPTAGPKTGQAPGGPDLSTMVLEPTDVGQSGAVSFQAIHPRTRRRSQRTSGAPAGRVVDVRTADWLVAERDGGDVRRDVPRRSWHRLRTRRTRDSDTGRPECGERPRNRVHHHGDEGTEPSSR